MIRVLKKAGQIVIQKDGLDEYTLPMGTSVRTINENYIEINSPSGIVYASGSPSNFEDQSGTPFLNSSEFEDYWQQLQNVGASLSNVFALNSFDLPISAASNTPTVFFTLRATSKLLLRVVSLGSVSNSINFSGRINLYLNPDITNIAALGAAQSLPNAVPITYRLPLAASSTNRATIAYTQNNIPKYSGNIAGRFGNIDISNLVIPMQTNDVIALAGETVLGTGTSNLSGTLNFQIV